MVINETIITNQLLKSLAKCTLRDGWIIPLPVSYRTKDPGGDKWTVEETGMTPTTLSQGSLNDTEEGTQDRKLSRG